jgi:hypothetical protein
MERGDIYERLGGTKYEIIDFATNLKGTTEYVILKCLLDGSIRSVEKEIFESKLGTLSEGSVSLFKHLRRTHDCNDFGETGEWKDNPGKPN